MPALGYGTCCRESASGNAILESTKLYLASGGRLIDTAQLYGNHREIGLAIRESKVPRDQIWVTSKVNPEDSRTEEQALAAVDKSLQELGLSYLDLMLIHGAGGWGLTDDWDLAIWKGLISAQRAGKVRSIGVSNHNRQEIEALRAKTGVLPALNQLEYHPWVPPETKELVSWCLSQGIAVTAYGSLGGAGAKVRDEAVVTKMAKRLGVSKAKVLLRWALDQGVAVIPGATSEEHIKDNLNLMDFHLTPRDKEELESSERDASFRRWHSCKTGCAN